jgi:hypothetical protein
MPVALWNAAELLFALPLERLLEVVAGLLELRHSSVALAFVFERLVATGATGKLLRLATEVLT